MNLPARRKPTLLTQAVVSIAYCAAERGTPNRISVARPIAPYMHLIIGTRVSGFGLWFRGLHNPFHYKRMTR